MEAAKRAWLATAKGKESTKKAKDKWRMSPSGKASGKRTVARRLAKLTVQS